MTWLPPPPRDREPSGRAWLPRGLALSAEHLSALSYVVVEEIVGPRATLLVSPWPEVDTRGRLDFRGRSRIAAVSLRELERRLAAEREVAPIEALDERELEAARRRAVAVGDVFAATVAQGRLARDLDRWLSPPIIDISAQAREAAQASFLAAVAPTLAPDKARRVLELPEEEAGPR